MEKLIVSVLVYLWLFFVMQSVTGQEVKPAHLFRFYEDNDYINIMGKGTDKAYTNGIRFDFFFNSRHRKSIFFDSWLPTAGDSSINVSGYGVEQLMFTPNNICTPAIQYDDYPYAGALMGIHSFYSYNEIKKLDVQTEIVGGVRGSASFASQTQVFIHRLIHYHRPEGWDNQLRNKILANINFSMEKQLAGFRHSVEVIGGGAIALGTYQNSITIYPLIRIGKMDAYFNGFLRQYKTKAGKGFQAYFIIKPELQLQLFNALVTGNMETNTKEENNENVSGGIQGTFHRLSPLVYSMNGGFVIADGNFSFSFNQNLSSSLLSNMYSHAVGNISLYFSW